MKVGICARVSTKDRQEVENQLRQLREFAAMQGWTIYREDCKLSKETTLGHDSVWGARGFINKVRDHHR